MRYKMTSLDRSVECTLVVNRFWAWSPGLNPKEMINMITKQLVDPQRRRRIPHQFSWIDHRLVKDHYLQRCSHAAAALYLFVLTVADADGLSYYADRTLEERVHMGGGELRRARGELIELGLVAYRRPIYQVLDLSGPPPGHPCFRKANR
jgi:hypothetical protein